MKVNKSIIMLILVIFLFSLASVCAGEMDDMISSDDTDQIELASNDKISEDNLQTNEEKATLGESDDSTDVSLKSSDGDELSSSGEFDELQKLIDNASDKSTINLERNYTYTIGTDNITEGISITKNLTINGNGFAIDAQGKSRIFNIESGINVVLNNITFINGYTEGNGGAILAYGNADISGSRFINNTADYGGAVYIFGTGEVRDCVFINNTAIEFAGALMMIYGTVSDSSFTGNTAHIGGAVRINGEATVTKCNFTDNTATLEGGAVYLGSPGNVAFSNFIGNKATGDGVGGGAVLLYEGGNVSYSNFTNNHVSTDGGAVHFYDNGTLSYCNFYDNEAGVTGGAVYFYNDGTVSNSNFIGNEANGEIGSGGAICFDEAGNVINSIFTANKATRTGGAIYVGEKSTNNNFSAQFYNNHAGQSGGAIFFNNLAENNNFDCVFKGNNASYGGAMFFYNKANGNKIEGEFINNTAKSCGGAMFFYNTTDGNNFTGIFVNNSALGQLDSTVGNGGAITFKNVSTNCVFTCDFINNTASLNGGAVNYREDPSNITFNSNFINDTSYTGGGVNFFGNFENVIFNGEFIGNFAKFGGAIATVNGIIKGVSFRDNHAEIGGAVFISKSGEIMDCNFTANTADYGGAIYLDMEFINIINCNFINNTASASGAAVNIEIGDVADCNFINNTASDSGGAVVMSSGNVANCNFTGNTASKLGGAVVMDSGNVANCNFTANTAKSDGGAVCFKRAGNVTSCKFEDNSADFGGAICSEITVNVADSNFTGNTASVEGGALYMGSGNIENSNFSNNKACDEDGDGDGGAVYITGNATVVNSKFTGNKADTGSAIYFWTLAEFTYVRSISHSTFLNNRANMDNHVPFDATMNGTNLEIRFLGNDNLLNAILSRRNADVNVTNVTYWGANGIENTGDVTIVPVMSYMEAGQNVTVRGVVNGANINVTGVTDDEGKIVLENVGDYNITVSHNEDSYYSSAEMFLTNRLFSLNVTDITTNNKTVNITAKSDILSEIMPGDVVFRLSDEESVRAYYAGNGTWWRVYTFDDFGTYKVGASFSGPYNVSIRNATIAVLKVMEPGDVKVDVVGGKVTVTVPSDVTGNVRVIINNVTYPVTVSKGTGTVNVPSVPAGDVAVVISNDTKYGNVSFNATPTVIAVSLDSNRNINVFYLEPASYSVRVIDSNKKPVAGVSVKFTVAGKVYSVLTDANGVATIKPSLAPGKYTVTAGYFDKSVSNSFTVKQIIQAKKTTNVKKSKKQTVIPITVKGHKVKQSVNVKFAYKGKTKVSVNFGKDMKKQTVTVKFKGKTYKVKVNAKGKGTLKLAKKVAKKLKKGKKYTAKVTYTGPKLYKNVKLTVKFNGKNYKVKTASNGVGKFKVTKKMVKRLKKGKTVSYTVTYKQASLERFVKIK